MKRYSEEFKTQAVNQVIQNNYSVASVAERLGITSKSLYDWIKRYGPHQESYQEARNQEQELRRLKLELKRVTEERDILKKAAAYFAKESE